MDELNKHLIKNTIILGIGSFATKFLSFFLVPLYTYILSAEEYGIIDFLYTFCTILAPIITFNISEAVLRFSMDKDSDNTKIMSAGNVFIIFSIIVGLITIPIINLFDNYREYSIFFYLYLISTCISQIFLCNLKGKEQLVEFSIGNIIQTIGIVVFNIIFLVFLKFKIKGYFSAYIITNILVSIYAFFRGNVYDSIKNFTFDIKFVKDMIKYSLFLIPTSFMWWIINSSDRIMVSKLISLSANGIYAISYKLPTILSAITTVFMQAWMYSAVEIKENNNSEEYTNLIYNMLFRTIIIISTGILMIEKVFLKIYVSAEYYEAWKYVPFLMVGFVFLTLANFLSTSYSAHKDSKGLLISGTVGACANIVINFLLIPRIGIYGAAIGTLLSYILVFIYRIIDTRRYVKIKAFKYNYVLLIILLILQAGAVFINGIIGQIMLFLGFAIILFANRDYIYSLIKMVLKKFSKKGEIV